MKPAGSIARKGDCKEFMHAHALSVTVVIPAFNEETNIARLVRQILNEPWSDAVVLNRLIVIDDCSDDRTLEIIQRLASEHERVSFISHTERSGKNAGIRDGIAACTSDVVAILDADVSLQHGCVTETVQLLVDDPSLAAASCVNEPLPARTWREYASRFQALILTEISRIGGGSLLRVYAIKTTLIRDLVLPDTTHDDLYIPRWLHNKGYRYAIQPQAVAYMRSASGLRDFAKQALRAWHAIEALDRVLPNERAYCKGQSVTVRAVLRAVKREPVGFGVYILWRAIIAATPAGLWLPIVDHTKHDTSRSTKIL